MAESIIAKDKAIDIDDVTKFEYIKVLKFKCEKSNEEQKINGCFFSFFLFLVFYA